MFWVYSKFIQRVTTVVSNMLLLSIKRVVFLKMSTDSQSLSEPTGYLSVTKCIG